MKRLLSAALLLALCLGAAPTPELAFTYRLKTPALTSAGIYDEAGRLVRVLWTMEQRPAGKITAHWDGNDAAGQPAPAGRYTFKVVANRSTYVNRGTIGNTGQPPNTFGHVPINFEAVAVGADGYIYTTHDWDEPHHDVIRWAPDTGYVACHSGHPISAMVRALTVDDEFAYVTIHAGATKARPWPRFSIGRLRINKEPGTTDWPVAPFTKAGERLLVYDAPLAIPADASAAERELMMRPLWSLAVDATTLYATDAAAGLVRRYDKRTGEPTGVIAAPLAVSVALDKAGRIWVGHGHHQVSVFDATGQPLATPITNLVEVRTLAFGPDGALYAADSGAGQVRVYAIDNLKATLQRTLGQPAQPGDRAADRFYHLMGAAVDATGHIITIQNEYFYNGGRLAKFTAAGKLEWEQLGLEFSSNGNYDPAAPDIFYTIPQHVYQLDRATGGWTYRGNSFTGTPYRRGAASSLRIWRHGNKELAFVPGGRGVLVYEIVPNADPQLAPTFQLVSILAGPGDLADGTHTEEIMKPENRHLWSWQDDQGDHAPQPGEIHYWTKPGDDQPFWQYGPVTVDARANLWFVSAGRGEGTADDKAKLNSIWRVPLTGYNQLGNPIYDWTNATCAIAGESLHWRMGLKMAQHDSATEMTYVYGYTRRAGTPQPGGVWMGGNTLAGFHGTNCQWQIVLPDICVGIDVIPGGPGGCIIGGNPWQGRIHHYTRDGLLIGIIGPDPAIMGAKPNNPSGLLDMFAAITVNRDPRDGILDVFVEENYNLRIAWYRIDDRKIQTIQGKLTK